jgi:NAD(P)-dependent dehydrogenase (short-subunit alcohol dehydrogenase family)
MDKVCLITGANSGIGKVTTTELARMGATVVLVCRDRGKGEVAMEEIRRETGNDKLDLLLADLSEMRQVKTLAGIVKARLPRLDVLVNNAGAFNSSRTLTPDGYEMTFAVNHLAYFLLTVELLDLLKASAPARIVNVASDAHRGGRINFDDLHGEKSYGGWKAYAQSKLANVLFTYELSRRLQGSGVTVNAVHPGGVATNFFNNIKGPIGAVTRWLTPLMRTPEQGADTVIWLASSPEVEGVTGRYFARREEKKSNRESYDPDVARRLWEVSERLTQACSTSSASNSAIETAG